MAQILVVEDDPFVGEVLTRTLERAGHAVLLVGNGVDGLVLAQQHAPDLVLMDLSLPGMNGWTATRQLKGHVATTKTPVVALTGSWQLDAAQARRHGFDDVIHKPFEIESVLAQIAALTPEPGAAGSPGRHDGYDAALDRAIACDG